MKIWKKTLAVAMSLALCVSMAAPAFAANFQDLQDAIDGKGGQAIAESGREGYAQREDGSYGIEAWNGDDGSRNVQLNEDVIQENEDSEAPADLSGITIESETNVKLDLNGNSIEGNGSSAILTVMGDDPYTLESENPAALTVTGEGQITGGGGGVCVQAGASLTVEGGAEITGNERYDVWLDFQATNTSAPEEGGTGATVTGAAWTDENGKLYTGTVNSADQNQSLSLTSSTNASTGNGGTPAAPFETEIGDTDVPLSGDMMTGAEFVDAIWQYEGEPDSGLAAVGVPADHEYAPAIAWAQSIGLIDDGFQLDELLTVADARIILIRLAAWKGTEMPELAALTGEDDDPVLNCAEVLKEFFGED